jgi:uncharacterized protein (TIGR00725 family)
VTDLLTTVAVIGGARCGDHQRDLAHGVGRELAEVGVVLLCGGRGGVMAAAAEGARSAGGRTVGILPGANRAESPPNDSIELAVFTGMGQARNQILVLSADAVIGIGGGWGTLTEIGLALKHGVPVVLLDSWRLQRPDGEPEPLLLAAATPRAAVKLALQAIRSNHRS